MSSPETIAGALAQVLEHRARELGQDPEERRPLVRYQKDPGRYALEVLGVRLMPEQLEILEAIRDHRRVAVRGGRKVGKDFALAAAALWFYDCFPGARVRFTAVKAEQVDDIFWRELRMMLAGAGRCADCKRSDPTGPKPCPHSSVIPETPGILARTGLRSDDFREIVGYTAREAEGAAGVSGGHQLVIVDEASAVDDAQIEAIEGNLLGCVVGRLVLISNPTRTSGQFYRAFHVESQLWRTFHRSSRDIAKKYGGRIPGIATLSEIEAIVEKYGAASDFVTVHIEGNFVRGEIGLIFDVHSLEAAIERHKDVKAEGPLYLGIDVAGESGTGDESAFCGRRGMRLVHLEARRGMSAEEHLTHALRLGAAYPSEDPTHKPIVVVDRGGEAGAKVWGVFVAYRASCWDNPPFVLVGVDSSRKAQRDPKAFDRVRDELVANLADWMRGGGAIPNDPKLAAELNQFRWAERRFDHEPNKLIDKKKIREALGRSPDRADALGLSCWVERHWKPPTATEAAVPVDAPPQDLADANTIWQGDAPDGQPDPGDPWWPKG